MNLKLLGVLVSLPLLASCAINQTVRSVERVESRQVCIVENTAVSQAGFLPAYIRALKAKGYTVRQLPSGSPLDACPLMSTYTANWRWDMALYMAFAELKVYSDGNLTGEAKYDAMSGGANMNKFIKADAKITELVDRLFPPAPR